MKSRNDPGTAEDSFQVQKPRNASGAADRQMPKLARPPLPLPWRPAIGNRRRRKTSIPLIQFRCPGEAALDGARVALTVETVGKLPLSLCIRLE